MNGLHLESPVKELGVILEAVRKWGKQAGSAEGSVTLGRRSFIRGLTIMGHKLQCPLRSATH